MLNRNFPADNVTRRPIVKRLRIPAAVVLASALVLTGCSSNGATPNGEDTGTASSEDTGTASSLEIQQGLSAGETDLYGPIDPAATTGGTVTIASQTEPPSLDPFHQASDARIALSGLMYQGLMYESASGIALPLLAEKVDVSEDGLSYTFNLRDGVMFHTGDQMTAADVKYSYDYIRDPDNGSPGASDFQAIEEIETPDDGTVVMNLGEPNAALLMTLTNKYGGVVPADYFDSPDAMNQLNEESVGTGPYELVALERNSSLTLKRNKDYWGENGPYIDELIFQFMPTSAAIVVALENGRVDMAVLPLVQDAQRFAGSEQIKLTTFPSLNHKALDLDSEYKQLKDVRVRQAIAAAIDKSVVAQAAAPDQHQLLGTIVAGMQETWGLPLDEGPYQEQDIELAKELLAEAGYPDGFQIDLRIINGYDWMDAAAVVITQQLAQIGIQVETKKLELGIWIENFQSRNMGFTMNDWGTQPDPNLLYYRHYHQQPEGVDFRNWNNKEASELLDQGIATVDREERVEIYRDFQKVFAETVPTVMLYSPEWVVATNKRLRNYAHHPTGWYFGLVEAYVTE